MDKLTKTPPKKERKTVSFYSFGCRLNRAETSIIKNRFQNSGYTIVDFGAPAETVVVNTCTVTENGDTDTRRLVHKINRQTPGARIALVGCQAESHGSKLLSLNNVGWVVGNERKLDLPEIITSSLNKNIQQVILPTIKRKNFTLPAPAIDRHLTRANLKIQDGCDFFCSFCVIPYTRGRARSRVFEDLTKEAEILTQEGFKELVLTGINLGTYDYEDRTFLDVIKYLLSLPQLKRLRISSIEPTTIPLELLTIMSTHKKFCRHLHIPIQSAHNNLLEQMKRKYTIEEYTDFLYKAYSKIPDVCLGTDVIVGFPGETDALFAENYEVLESLPFAYFHVFSYSERQRTRSKKLPNQVEIITTKKRSQMLRDLSKQKRVSYYKRFLGTTQAVLFEQQKNGLWIGLTDTYIRVGVHSAKDLGNQIIPVRLEQVQGQMMVGTVM